MNKRVLQFGRLLDQSRTVSFSFNGKKLVGHPGDTLASALLANDQHLVGRSFKYHRPRGIVAAGPEEPNALFGLNRGARFEPNQLGTTTELFEGLEACSQNHWPSLECDFGEVNSLLSRFLPAGFYYKTFIHPRAFWKHVYEPLIRRSAGLGRPPSEPDSDTYEYLYLFIDILVIGGGIAGLQAAKSAAQAGARVLVIEQSPHWGGRTVVDATTAADTIGDLSAEQYVNQILNELRNMPNVALRNRTMGAAVYDHGYVLAYERCTDHDPVAAGPRHRLWRIRAAQVICATGAIERPMTFAGNDIPGVMLASAVRDYLVNYAVMVGHHTVVMTNNDDAYVTAILLKKAGAASVRVLDTRAQHESDLKTATEALSIPVSHGRAIARVMGRKRVKSVKICDVSGTGGIIEEIPADIVAMSGGWSPTLHLWSHCGGKAEWDFRQAMLRPKADCPPVGADGRGFVRCAGAANGELDLQDCLNQATETGSRAASDIGLNVAEVEVPVAPRRSETAIQPVWQLPAHADHDLQAKSWIDFQNDVKVTDIQLAVREGFESVEHTKRYTTLGMATDQGKLSNINGLAVLSGSLNQSIDATGTTTFRPPYTPISMGAIAGEARANLFQPVRCTPMHQWHQDHGAVWEPVGQWRRPFTYQQKNESVDEAVVREIKNTRENLGLLDASTLGKLIVKGPDAARFLDMLYTNMMSSLPVGRCRYGLMCSENGFLMDDGVVVRLSEDSFLCHTTTGGADHVHRHMEEWLQTEWWDWQVYVANITEQYAQIGVVGPNARKVLQKLGGMTLAADELPFMAWQDGELGGFRARVYRISFSGELSYEIAVPAGQGLSLWSTLIEAGEEFGIMPYGTEALHVMRAEKGFIMIGDETDGTVTPQDLNLNWAISKKKKDYIGKRAQQRDYMVHADRWRLVGLESLDGSVLPEGAYMVEDGRNALGQENMIGRVTSTYYSPTLGKGIAMGLVRHGPDRMGDVLLVADLEGGHRKARIVNPIFYDREHTKQNV
ncbi:MAG: sarcosine oxidase subunit alpha family protein [Aestuariivita sp.]|nr:sarcosine oxidase subunit alpha family protein [Aestuariivita sp.]MCY4203686.1 sarcosine oxidase subunit alpha family protein [Aestuariivita sp.]MCY4287018.1 sarcosine oxidase subunit alpha family protein [Aestuariivita sp.]MCY4347665.1 sarcosine oxidase subunit alpha family protein [Aestuariivita sp.]